MWVEAVLLISAGVILGWLTFWDFRAHRLPDGLNAAFAALGVALYAWNGGAVGDGFDLALGSAFGAGLLYAVRTYFMWRTGREGLGLGDIKYVAAAGLWVGVEGIFIVVGLGSALTLLAVFGQRPMQLRDIRLDACKPIPFGPGLIVATIGVFCFLYTSLKA